MDRTIKRAACGLIAVAAATLPYAHPAQAQQTDVDALRAQIQQLQTRLDKIEADEAANQAASKMAAQAAPNVSVSSASKMPIVISGLLQVQALANLADNSPNRGTIYPDTFRLRRGELRLTAPQITNRLSATVMFDPTKSQNGAANNGVLQELELSYLLNKNAESSHYFDIGQFKLPIGYEGDLVSSSALQTVERALMYQTFPGSDPAGGRATDIRDTGAELRGSMGQFDYRLGVFNGLGERQNALSTSDNKAIIGRVVYHPTSALQFGVSAAHDGARNVVIGAVPNEGLNRDVYNAFAVYKKNKLTLQSEYLKGTFTDTPTNMVRDRDGYYVSGGYMFRPKLEGVLRYDRFDFNTSTPNNTTTEATVGVNYYLKGNNAKIQADVVRVTGPATAGEAVPLTPTGRTELRTSFQVGF